jgi:hypothetical protein
MPTSTNMLIKTLTDEAFIKTLKSMLSETRYAKLKSYAEQMPGFNVNEAPMMLHYCAVSMLIMNVDLQLCHFAELVLRNHLDAAFKKNLGLDWVQDLASKFNPRVAAIQHRSKAHQDFYSRVEKVKRHLSRNKKQWTNDNLVHELDFGFWDNLTKKTFYDYWQMIHGDFFAEKSDTFDKHKVGRINQLVGEIKHTRNRISHLQPYQISEEASNSSKHQDRVLNFLH